MTGKPVRLDWASKESRPTYAAWLENFQAGAPTPIGKTKKAALIERTGSGSLPAKLLTIPENRDMRPVVIDVSADIDTALFKTSRIPGDEIWLWGVTPASPCPPGGERSPLGIGVRMLDDKGRHQYLSGAFVWKVKAAKPGEPVTAFYFDESLGALESTAIKGLSRAGDAWQRNCDRHHGGACKFVFETDADDWGRWYRVRFKAGKPPHGCPV